MQDIQQIYAIKKVGGIWARRIPKANLEKLSTQLAIREQLQKILNESEHWDKKVCVLQVTNATDRTMEIRALMSAADASIAWTLRCEVREKLIEFIKAKYPQALPRVRAELNKIQDDSTLQKKKNTATKRRKRS